jgi:hypothetical protein
MGGRRGFRSSVPAAAAAGDDNNDGEGKKDEPEYREDSDDDDSDDDFTDNEHDNEDVMPPRDMPLQGTDDAMTSLVRVACVRACARRQMTNSACCLILTWQ